jgi:hypothetical protein
MAALAATGALIVGGSAVAMVGSGNADPLDLPGVPVAGTTYVVPDADGGLTHFTRDPGSGTSEISDELAPPAPAGGGEAALRLMTPTDPDKAAVRSVEDAGSALAAWIPTAAYSAYQNAADNDVQFPSMQLVVDFNGDAVGGFSTLTYEPVYNDGDDMTPNQWHRYRAGEGEWCSTREIPGVIAANETKCANGGDKPLSAYIAAQPNIIVNALLINQGTFNPGLDAGVDLVSTPSTTYDFELVEPPVVVPPVDPTDTCTETPEPSEEPSQEPSHPDEGQNGGHEDGGNEGHDNGHGDGGHEQSSDGGHEQPDDGAHEEPQPDPEPQPEPDPCK